MRKKHDNPIRERWARMRFAIVGPLLAAPPEHGALQGELSRLAEKSYQHPVTGERIRIGVSTIERWYYAAKNHPNDPVGALARKIPAHAGTHRSLSKALIRAIRAQYGEHPTWSYHLHYDNIIALSEEHPELGEVPSYSTIVRFMKSRGLRKQRKRRTRRGGRATVEPREVRSYEVEHVHGLWHADFHVGSRRILLPTGEWARCHLLGVLDDRSRLCCHLQWYLQETAETFVHGLSQAILKRGLPRSLMTDNGGAMLAAEVTEGLHRLAIVHFTTLPYTPEQNAKKETFWVLIEGQLLPMLEGEKILTLAVLNRATQAWVELGYHRRIHTTLAATPLSVAMAGPSVGRPAPEPEHLRRQFRTEETRAQRHSDGTLTVLGVRFEVPSRYRHLQRLSVRFARWDLSSIELVEERTGRFLCRLYPIDKRKNADRGRRTLSPVSDGRAFEDAGGLADELQTGHSTGIAPNLRKLMAEYAV